MRGFVVFFACALMCCNRGSTVAGATSSSDDASSTRGPTTGEETLLCDGDGEIALAVAFRGGSNVEPGAQLMTELGRWYLYVTGTCDYWVLPPPSDSQFWPRARGGTLSVDAAAALVAELSFQRWEEYAGCYWSAGSEGVGYEWRDTATAIFCDGDCTAAPDVVQSMNNQSALTISQIWAGADDGSLSDSVRIAVPLGYVDMDPNYVDPLAVPWPLAWPLETVAKVVLPGELGIGTLIEDPDDVEALRALAAQGENVLDVRGALVFQDGPGAPVYSLWLRDSIPFENTEGLIPGPDICAFPGCC